MCRKTPTIKKRELQLRLRRILLKTIKDITQRIYTTLDVYHEHWSTTLSLVINKIGH